MQVSTYRFTGEIDGYFVEGECECEYFTENGEDIPRLSTMVFDNIIITDKKTGVSEFYGEEVPDDMINVVKSIADEHFIVS
jgi:hypothetical protein